MVPVSGSIPDISNAPSTGFSTWITFDTTPQSIDIPSSILTDKDHAVEFCNLIDQTLEELTRIHEMVERKTKEESLNGEHPDMKNGVKKKARMKFTPKRPQDAPRQ
ncbi:uncharacterized protein LOC100899996 isoform X1 [Galendromus occidentalis]|uniref:Uncharacterized protein LOC100899996 isoform X1 n=1 Tax=Galendromus occidentalis TaxID=34638 RepID=A0AAJ7L7S9_9ACAR|nr:uncharacterized protein LOC100899996 isoform X1 [Galendromus occidentalis]